jgi:hypothetical protein
MQQRSVITSHEMIAIRDAMTDFSLPSSANVPAFLLKGPLGDRARAQRALVEFAEGFSATTDTNCIQLTSKRSTRVCGANNER